MKTNSHKVRAILLCAALVFGCAACGQTMAPSVPTQPPAPTAAPVPSTNVTPVPDPSSDTRAQERYSVGIPPDYDRVIFDGNGKLVPPEQQFELLKDIITGKPKYKQYTRAEDTGTDYEDGSPVVRHICALYDMEDKLLADWGEYGYKEVFGDFAISMEGSLIRNPMMVGADENNYCALWNVKTGKVAMERVERADRVDDSSVLLLPPGYNNPPLGIMDMDGTEPVFRPFPKGYNNVQILDNGYMTADIHKDGEEKSKNRDCVLMTKDYKILLEKPNLRGTYIGLRGPYLSYENGMEQGILSMDGKLLYTLPQGEDLGYFDGELVKTQRLNPASEEREWICRLIKVDGTELAGGYNQLNAIDISDFYNDAPTELFLGVRGETVELLNRSGKVIAAQTIPKLKEVRMAAEGAYIYSVPPRTGEAGGEPAEDYNTRDLWGILGSNLEILLQPSVYTYMEEIYSVGQDGVFQSFDLLRCVKTVSGGMERTDILDTSGKLLIENLTEVGDAGSDRIAVVKGFSAGVMDWQGNWIGKHSIFNSPEDEKESLF